MRVLWFSNKPPLGAKGSKNAIGGSWIESLEHELTTNSDFELGIVYTELAKDPMETFSETSNTRFFMVPRYPYKRFSRWVNRLLASPPSKKLLPEYLQIVDDFQPEVVLFFGTESDFPLIIPNLKIPSIIWFQGNLTVYKRMYQNGIRVSQAMKYESFKNVLMGESVLHDYFHFKRLVKREKQIFSVAENFIGRTDWDRRLVNIMAPQSRYFHCDEAMRLPFIENRWNQPLNRDRFVIVTTIQGNMYKGLETLFETSRFLKNRLKKELEWRVIGTSEDTTYVKAARKKVNFSSSNPEVKILGRKTGQELVQELLDADLYVHPSHIENSPNAVQEAMLLGMPVIATNVGGTPSMLTDGEEGLLVQSKDPYALAGAIFELYQSPDRARQMGENGRKLGLVRNNSKKICSDLLDIFEKLADSTKNTQRNI